MSVIRRREIIAWYEARFGVRPPELDTSGIYSLVECRGCGLQVFDPLEPGGNEHYDWVATLDRPPVSRWEFGQVLDDLSRPTTIIDYGAGSGVFARTARARGHAVACVERSSMAREQLAADGFPTFGTLSSARAAIGPADVMTCFQVLEHVGDPVTLLQELYRAVVRGGLVFVSVPNRSRPIFGPEPFDHPPHHVTRWNWHALRYAAAVADLEPLRVAYQPLDQSQAAHAVVNWQTLQRWKWFHSNVVAALNKPQVGALVSGWGKRGHPRLCGHSMLATFLSPVAGEL